MSVTKYEKEDIHALHSALVGKRINLNELVWQSPVIALTAQAFLLTIAFADGNNEFFRIISGIAATGIGLISWQVFLRHSAMEKQTSIEIEKFENEHFGKTVHAKPHLTKASWITQLRPRLIWGWGLFLISLIGLLPVGIWLFNLLYE